MLEISYICLHERSSAYKFPMGCGYSIVGIGIEIGIGIGIGLGRDGCA